jgi:hypothetical protein
MSPNVIGAAEVDGSVEVETGSAVEAEVDVTGVDEVATVTAVVVDSKAEDVVGVVTVE